MIIKIIKFLFHELIKICFKSFTTRGQRSLTFLISFFLPAIEQIAIRRRPLHQQVRRHVSKLLATQIASFTPKTRRRVRKMRPGIHRTTEEELTILVGFLQWRHSRSRPTQSRKATRKSLNISLFFPIKVRAIHRGFAALSLVVPYHVMSRVPCSKNRLIWYRLQAFDLKM